MDRPVIKRYSFGANRKRTLRAIVATVLVFALRLTSLGQTQPPVAPSCVNDGNSLKCRIEPGITHYFEVEFYNAGAILRVEIEECGTDLILALARGTNKVAESDFSDGDGRETITYVADQPGLYWVLVKPQEDSEGADYHLRQSGGDAATAADRQRIMAEGLLAETWTNIREGGRQGALRSVASLKKALPLWQQLDEKYWTSYTMMHLAKASEYLGNTDEALNSYLKALTLKRDITDHPGEATTLVSISQVYDAKGDRKEALTYAEKALPLVHSLADTRVEAITLNDIGLIKVRLNQHKQALSYFNRALALWKVNRDESGEAITLNNMMQAWKALGQLRLAASYGKLAVNKHQRLRMIANLQLEMEKLYLNSVNYSYRALADILITQGRFKEAQQTINYFKDQQFFDFDQEKRTKPSALVVTASEKAFAMQYEQILDRVQGPGKQLYDSRKKALKCRFKIEDSAALNELEAKWTKALEELNVALGVAETDFRQQPLEQDGDLAIDDTNEIQEGLRTLNALGKGQVVAIYTVVGAEHFNALLVTADNLYGISLPVEDEVLNAKAQQLWGLLQSRNYDPKKLAHDLYLALLRPIAHKLPVDTKTILWSLDGNLRYLPMAALYDGKQFLVERYNHVNFTRADRERMTRAPSRHWTGLGMGSSKGHTVELLDSRISFDALPGVNEELRAVFRAAGRAGGVLDGEVLPDDKFTRTAMVAALSHHRPVVHIASHFSFRPGDETRSFLLLGDGSVMTLAEMKAQRDLFGGVELLTLSACNTAAQRPDADGREIDAFAELAQRLGANSVMATLWPLSDDSSPWLMREFYRSRQAGGGMVKAEALRQAQLALLKGSARINPSQKARQETPTIVVGDGQRREGNTRADIVYVDAKNAPRYQRNKKKPFAHPYYWAPVVLIGNWR